MNDHDDLRHYKFGRIHDPYNSFEWKPSKFKRFLKDFLSAIVIATISLGIFLASWFITVGIGGQ